ncbi:MAG: ATP-dependent DNA helicase DinG [Pseudomonadales bacterium]|nr:ATP-dependent DNA helicase DinG [Pseudomonadales bacterium]
MLSDKLKKEIQSAYTRLLENRGYRSRFCQRQMVADIANTLANIETGEDGERTSDNHVCVIEAGTGTGKTVAYAIAALPIAAALGKKLVISTATVALQEQIVLRDLPDIRTHSGLDFSFTLAKGRRRYLCLARLDQALQAGNSMNHTLSLYEDEMFPTDLSNQHLYEEMLSRLGMGDWDGDRDSWPVEVDNSAWFPVSTDHVQCSGRKCSHFENCYFYKAREQINRVDCIVTNHDLVLSDLMMGGGAVLPEPEETIYVFDEGHHLPDKAISHFASFVMLRGTRQWLEQLPELMSQLTADVGDIGQLPRQLRSFQALSQDLCHRLDELHGLLMPYVDEAEGDDRDLRHRFAGGVIEAPVRSLCEEICNDTRRLEAMAGQVQADIESRLSDFDDPDREALETWLPLIASAAARLGGGAGLWFTWAQQDEEGEAPTARWLSFRDNEEIVLNASPVTVNTTLQELLWDRCYGAVLTSATLAVGGDFERFRLRSGISDQAHFRALGSPFHYQEQGLLKIPSMDVDPRNADAHNDAVAEMLPSLLRQARGSLVLFSSWRQMNRITDALEPALRQEILSQGELSKSEIVNEQKRRIDRGERSIIFGLASFAEGIDLPGAYCEHVIIIKIPFAVPDDPVGATLSEWIEQRGGNSFAEIMVPDAALRLVQACGRLLRTEADTGVVTLLDRRLVSQRYGRLLLNALPPFRREIS